MAIGGGGGGVVLRWRAWNGFLLGQRWALACALWVADARAVGVLARGSCLRVDVFAVDVFACGRVERYHTYPKLSEMHFVLLISGRARSIGTAAVQLSVAVLAPHLAAAVEYTRHLAHPNNRLYPQQYLIPGNAEVTVL